MSSQGVNSSNYSGVTVSDTSTPGQKGTPALYPMRDAQDFTLLKKRLGVFYAAGFSRLFRASTDVSYSQLNSNVLSFKFAQSQCNGCVIGP